MNDPTLPEIAGFVTFVNRIFTSVLIAISAVSLAMLTTLLASLLHWIPAIAVDEQGGGPRSVMDDGNRMMMRELTGILAIAVKLISYVPTVDGVQKPVQVMADVPIIGAVAIIPTIPN
jgi:hypothetical protein